MQTSKKLFIKRLLMPLFILVFFLLGEYFLGRLLTPVNSAVYFRDEIRKMKENGEHADILFLGTSRIYQSVYPEILEEKLDVNCVINGGTATQRPDSSYIFLKDLYREVKPGVVVLGVQWSSLMPEANEAGEIESTLMMYDRLSASGRMECLLRKFGSSVWFDLFPMYRYRKEFRFASIRDNLEKWENYRKNGFIPNTELEHYYHGKGFVYSNSSKASGNVPIQDEGEARFSVDDIVPEKLAAIDNIVDFCKKKGIKLYLISPPMSLMNLYHVEGYQEAVDFYEAYAEKNGLVYHNMNYLKDREDWLPDEMMADYVHLNGEGAACFTERYAEILRKDLNGEDTGEYFCRDLEELKKTVRRVVAIKAGFTPGDRSVRIEANCLCNDDVTPLYRFELSTDGGKTYELLQDWSEEAELIFEPAEGKYRFRILAALDPEDPKPAWQVYDQEF